MLQRFTPGSHTQRKKGTGSRPFITQGGPDSMSGWRQPQEAGGKPPEPPVRAHPFRCQSQPRQRETGKGDILHLQTFHIKSRDVDTVSDIPVRRIALEVDLVQPAVEGGGSA